MRKLLLSLGVIVPMLAVFSSCGGGSSGGKDGGGSGGAGGNSGGGSGGAGSVTYADIKAILASHSCDFCHSGGGSTLPTAMNLSGDPGAALVDIDSLECAGSGGRKRVNPGMPASSYLIDKLKGTGLCGGARMPLSAPPLSASEISLIEGWITAGASTN